MTVGRGVLFKKTRTDQCRALDMANLAGKLDFTRALTGSISWGPQDNPTAIIGVTVIPNAALHLFYTVTDRQGVKTDCSYTVDITTTACYFGGERWWFRCPSCGRRCRILYQPPNQLYFACRLCHKLTYKSQQEGKRQLASVFRFPRDWPEWSRRLSRSRSSRKRAALLRKIGSVERAIRLIEPTTRQESDE